MVRNGHEAVHYRRPATADLTDKPGPESNDVGSPALAEHDVVESAALLDLLLERPPSAHGHDRNTEAMVLESRRQLDELSLCSAATERLNEENDARRFLTDAHSAEVCDTNTNSLQP